MTTIAPREGRLNLRDCGKARVTVSRGDELSADGIEAELVDLTPGGAKLRVRESFAIHEAVVIRISVREIELELALPAEVRWLRRADNGDWWLGCAFRPKVEASLMAMLAVTGQLERRSDPRKLLRLSACARWPLEGEAWSCTVQDYSTGGFCLLLDRGGRAGKRLLLEIVRPDGVVKVNAHVLWELETHEGFLLGCEFRDSSGAQALAGCVEDPAAAADPKARRTRGGFWFGLGLFAVLVCAYLLKSHDLGRRIEWLRNWRPLSWIQTSVWAPDHP